MGADVRVQGADVPPVPDEAVLPHAPPRHERRDDALPVVAEGGAHGVAVLIGLALVLGGRLVLARHEVADHLGERGDVEHEHLGGHERARRVLRLVGVVGHGAVVVHLHDAEARGVLVRLGGDHGELGAGAGVLGQHGAQVQLVQVVRGEHDDGLGAELLQQRQLLGDRVAVAAGEALLGAALRGRQEPQAVAGAVEIPRPAAGQVLVEREGAVLLHDPHVPQARVGQVGQDDVDQPVLARQRHHRLGAGRGERHEAAAGAAGQHERDDGALRVLGERVGHGSSSGRGRVQRRERGGHAATVRARPGQRWQCGHHHSRRASSSGEP